MRRSFLTSGRDQASRSNGKRKLKMKAGIVALLMALCLTGCTKDAEKFYQNGIKCMDQKNYEQAASYFKEAIKKQDDKAEYYIAYGMALTAANDLEGAKEALERAVVDKENSIVKVNNKLAYRGLGICASKEGNYEKAEEYFKQALEINAQNELDQDLICFLTDTYLAQGNPEAAKELLEDAIGENGSQVLYTKRAAVFMEMGEYEKAIADYEQVKTASPDCIFGKYQAYTGLGRTQEAKQVLQEALDVVPEGAKEKYSYARLLYYAGEEDASYYEEGMKYFEEVCTEYPESLYYMGKIAQKQMDYAKACEYYEKYIDQCPELVEGVYLELGSCYALDGQAQEAASVLKDGYEKVEYGEKKKLAYALTRQYEQAADYDSAYEFVKKYTEDFPDDATMETELKFLKTRTSEFAKDHGKKDFYTLSGETPEDAFGEPKTDETTAEPETDETTKDEEDAETSTDGTVNDSSAAGDDEEALSGADYQNGYEQIY